MVRKRERDGRMVVSVRLSSSELAVLDASGLSRSEALRTLLGDLSWEESAFVGSSLPVLWSDLIREVDHALRLQPAMRADVLALVVPAVHQEDYRAAVAGWREVQAEWEPSRMVRLSGLVL